MNIGILTIEMAANIGRLQKDMSEAKTVVDTSMKAIQASVDLAKSAFIALTGIASFSAFKGMIEGVIQTKVELQRLSIQTGASVESLSAISAVAKLTGTDIGSVGSAMNKLQKNLASSTEESKGAAQAIQALGLNFDAFSRLSADQQMLAVAKAMAQFADGGGKSAAAMMLFGKTGAQLLPMLKDLADANELVGKQTTESARQAEEYEKNMKRLEMASAGLRREFVELLLPSMEHITAEMVRARKAGDGLFGTLSAGLKAWWNGTEEQANNKKLFELTDQLLVAENNLQRARASNLPVVERSVPAYLAQVDAIKKQIAAVQALRSVSDPDNESAAERNRLRRLKELDPNLGAKGAKVPTGPKDDPSLKILEGQLKEQENYIASQKRLLGENVKTLDYYQQLEYITLRDAETSKQALLQDALDKELVAYDKEIKAVTAYIAEKKRLGQETATADGENRLAEAIKRRSDAEHDAGERTLESQRRLRAVKTQFDLATVEHARMDRIGNESAQFQIDMLGKNTLEVMKLTEARRVQLDLDQRIYQLKKLDPLADTSGAIAQAAVQTAQATALIAAAYDKQRSAIFGADEALRKYIEDAGNQAGKMEQMVGNAFQGMEDALTTFATTGKLSFSSFATSVVADINRMIIKQQLLLPLAEYMKAGSSGGTGLSGLLSGLIGGGSSAASYTGLGGATGSALSMGFGGTYADGGDPPMGRVSLVGERGPELFIPKTAGTIVPASMVNAGGNRTVSVVNNFTLQAPTDTRTQNQIAAKAGWAIRQAMERNA